MRTSAIVIALLLSSVPLHAQSRDWNRLESLSQGTELIVETGRSLRCTLSFVDDAGIKCATRFRSIHIDRTHVIAVSLSKPGRIIGIGTLIGAAAGASALAAREDTPAARPVDAIVGAVLGGFGGYVVGHIIRLSPGPTIYVRP